MGPHPPLLLPPPPPPQPRPRGPPPLASRPPPPAAVPARQSLLPASRSTRWRRPRPAGRVCTRHSRLAQDIGPVLPGPPVSPQHPPAGQLESRGGWGLHLAARPAETRQLAVSPVAPEAHAEHVDSARALEADPPARLQVDDGASRSAKLDLVPCLHQLGDGHQGSLDARNLEHEA